MLSWLAILFPCVWLLAECKRGRSDGTLLRTHPIRRLMYYIMPTRAESVVYFEVAPPADPLLGWVARARAHLDVDLTHALVATVGLALERNPHLNRFVSGRRLYARRGRYVSFSMKRKQMDRAAQLSVVKLELLDGERGRDLVARINAAVHRERSGEVTATDREYALLDALPRPVLRPLVWLVKVLDYYNLLPGFFLRSDGLYTSAFLANLGSLGMGAGFHHLYEWGNCPFFVLVGKVEERAVVEQGAVVVRRVLPVRFTYDERVDDGLAAAAGIQTFLDVLAAPDQWLGPPDGSAPLGGDSSSRSS